MDQLHYSYHEIGKLHSVKLEYNNAGSFSLASHWKTHSKHNRWNVKMQQKKKRKKKKKEGFVFGKRKGEKPVFQSFQLLSTVVCVNFLSRDRRSLSSETCFFFSS